MSEIYTTDEIPARVKINPKAIGDTKSKAQSPQKSPTKVDYVKWSTNPQKYKAFISEPIGLKPVTDIPGIGENLGKRLTNVGYGKAYSVLGQFLLLNRSKDGFTAWLRDSFHANERQAVDTYNCLLEWCQENL